YRLCYIAKRAHFQVALVRILMAEDDESTREIFKALLEARGHTVELAANGDQCIKTYKSSTQFALVVLDYKMPGKDGLTVAMEIQTMNPKQKIMIASAYCREVMD